MDVLRDQEFFGKTIATYEAGAFAVAVTEYSPATALAWHDHTGPYLTYIERGGYRERLRKSSRECPAGAVVPHIGGEIHADEFRAATRCINIQPNAEWLAEWNLNFDDCQPLVSVGTSSVMARLKLELRRNDRFSTMVSEALILELVAAFVREQQDHVAPRWLRNVRDEIIARFQKPLTLSALASAARVHPVHLARSFRRHFGQTVGAVVRAERIEYSKRRILAGVSLSDVALEAGFADQSHFTRTFRALTGTTPADFRRSNRVPRR